MGFIDHAVRRGLEHPSTVNLFKRAVSEGPKIEVPTWGIVLLVTTCIGFVVLLSAVEYSLKNVVATLAMVETPSAAITVSPSTESAPKDTKEGLLETGPTITLVHTKPITSSIRGTFRHLKAQAGRLARVRAFKSFALYRLAFGLVVNIIEAFVPRLIPGRLVLIAAITGALLANLHAVWTHQVVSMPTTTSFWQRVPSRRSWKLLAFPAAVQASMPYISIYIAQGFFAILGIGRIGQDNFAEYTCAQWTSLIFRILAVFVILLSYGLFICLPAVVTLIRIEASILPEDQDTIVPFDRTFAGKVVPQILGGTGCIGFLDAWRSFTWEARRRLIKLYAKIFFIMTAIFLVFVHVLAFEVFAVMGPAVRKFIAQAQEQGFGQ